MIDLSFQTVPGSIKTSISDLNTETLVKQNHLDCLFTLPDFLHHEGNIQY